MVLGAVLLGCGGCVVAPPPPTVGPGPAAESYGSYPYYPYYAPNYDFPWNVGPQIGIGLGFGLGGWDGWHGDGGRRGGRERGDGRR
jgi:hypothetical protein